MEVDQPEITLRIVSIEATEADPEKANYASYTRRAKFTMADAEGKSYTTTMIMKWPLFQEEDAVRSTDFVANEHFAYSAVLPKFGIEAPLIPRYHWSSRGMTLLEDLGKPFVSKTAENISEVEIDVAMKELANFHSKSLSSLSAEQQALVSKLKDYHFDYEDTKNLNTSLKTMELTFLLAHHELKNYEPTVNAEEKEKYAKMIKNMLSMFVKSYNKVSDMLKSSPRKVLSHGDFWPNNLMFDPNTNTFKMIDFQAITYSSIARDILYFLAALVDKEDNVNDMNQRRQEIVDKYVKYLKQSNAHKTEEETKNLVKDFESEMEKLKLFELIVALWLLPATTSDPEARRNLHYQELSAKSEDLDKILLIQKTLVRSTYNKYLMNKLRYFDQMKYFPTE